METRMKRRTVYAVTIVAMLATVSGFALASGTFGTFGTLSVGGNQGSVTTTDTIYASGLSGSEFWVAAGGSGGTCTAPSSTGTTSVVVTAWVAGGPGACTATSDYVLQLTFTSANSLTSSKTYTDEFVISSEFGSASSFTTSQVSIGCALGATGDQCTAVINIDTGTSAIEAQPGMVSLGVTVTGS